MICFMNFMNFKFFLLQHKKIYTLKLIVALNSSLLHHDICFQSFFLSFFKADLHSVNVICPTNPICWQMCCFGQNYRLEELINKLLTKWNLSQAFLIHCTLCLYLWLSLYLRWRVSRLVDVFPEVSSLDEKSLGKLGNIVLILFLWKCK